MLSIPGGTFLFGQPKIIFSCVEYEKPPQNKQNPDYLRVFQLQHKKKWIWAVEKKKSHEGSRASIDLSPKHIKKVEKYCGKMHYISIF